MSRIHRLYKNLLAGKGPNFSRYAAINVVDEVDTYDQVHQLSDIDKYPQDQIEHNSEQGNGGLKIEGAPIDDDYENELEHSKRLMSQPRPGIEDLMQDRVPHGKPIQDWKADEPTDMAMVRDQMSENEGNVDQDMYRHQAPIDISNVHNKYEVVGWESWRGMPPNNEILMNKAWESIGEPDEWYMTPIETGYIMSLYPMYEQIDPYQGDSYGPFFSLIDSNAWVLAFNTAEGVDGLNGEMSGRPIDRVINNENFDTYDQDLDKESVALPDSGAIDENSYGQDYGRADQSISRAPYTKLIYRK